MNIGGNQLGKQVVIVSCDVTHHTSIQEVYLSQIYLGQDEVPHFKDFFFFLVNM